MENEVWMKYDNAPETLSVWELRGLAMRELVMEHVRRVYGDIPERPFMVAHDQAVFRLPIDKNRIEVISLQMDLEERKVQVTSSYILDDKLDELPF